MALTTNLVSYWKLDESSGNAADSVGSNTLTNNNTVTYASGKINNGANFVRTSSQSLSIAYATQTGLNITGALTVASWVKIASQPSSTIDGRAIVVMEAAPGGTDQGYSLEYFNNGSATGLRFYIFKDGGFFDATHLASDLPNGEWHFVVGQFTPSTKVELFLDNVSVASNTTSIPATIGDGQCPFTLGNRSNGTTSYLMNGMEDEVGVWNRVLTGTELTSLYNSGAGLQYPFTTTTANPHMLSSTGVGA